MTDKTSDIRFFFTTWRTLKVTRRLADNLTLFLVFGEALKVRKILSSTKIQKMSYLLILFLQSLRRPAIQEKVLLQTMVCLATFSEIIHMNSGVIFEPSNTILRYQTPTTIQFTLPLEVKIGSGPFQAQAKLSYFVQIKLIIVVISQ